MRAAPTNLAVVLFAVSVPLAVLWVGLSPGSWTFPLLWPLGLALATLADGVVGALRYQPRLATSPRLSLEVGRAAKLDVPLEATTSDLQAMLETSPWLDAECLSEVGDQPSFRMLAKRRGTRKIEALHLRWFGPLRLVAQVRRLRLDTEVPVTVDLGTVRDEVMSLVSQGVMGDTELQKTGSGSEFNSLRLWTQGMDARSIDWKRSARHRDLVAREVRDEQNQTVTVVVDSGRTMTDPITDGGLSRLDYAVTAGLLTMFVALKRGDAVALFGFDKAPQVGTGLLTGSRAFAEASHAAASIDYSVDETNFTLGLSRVASALQRRSLIICFTEIVDTTAAELMIESAAQLLRDHYVLFVVLKDPDVEQMAEAQPKEPKDIGRAVIAASLQQARREVFTKLRHLGIEVLEIGADESAPAVVRRYLDIKKRGAL